MNRAARRHAVKHFTTVWTDRLDRNQDLFDRIAAGTIGLIVGALIVTGMVVARLYQQGLI